MHFREWGKNGTAFDIRLTMSFSGKVRPPAVEADDATDATEVPDPLRRMAVPDARRRGADGCWSEGDAGDDMLVWSGGSKTVVPIWGCPNRLLSAETRGRGRAVICAPLLPPPPGIIYRWDE